MNKHEDASKMESLIEDVVSFVFLASIVPTIIYFEIKDAVYIIKNLIKLQLTPQSDADKNIPLKKTGFGIEI